MAEGYAEKLTVLDILTATTNKEQWIVDTKKELEQKERENCTFHPKTNNYVPKKKKNEDGDEEEEQDESHTTYGIGEGTGDKCYDLYNLALIKKQQQRRTDKTAEEYEFEKN